MKQEHPPIIFSACAPSDQSWLWRWEAHLRPLSQAGLLSTWSEHHLPPGVERLQQLQDHLDQADLIVLLLSADFFTDDHCIMLMERAFTRHQQGTAQIIPLLLRPISWRVTPLGTFPPLPSNSRPVTQWNDPEAALVDCVDGIHHILSHPVAPQLIHATNPDKQPSDHPFEAVEYSTCFISYSSKDQAFATRLYTDLQYRGVRCWFAPEDLKIGDPFRQRIDESIRKFDKLLLILSTHSVASPWVEKEVETAFEKEHRTNRLVLFPVKLDESIMQTDRAWAADIRRTRHIGDFTHWKEYDAYQAMLERLLHSLKTGTT